MRLAIWGAAGFVGGAIVQAAAAEGSVLVRLPHLNLTGLAVTPRGADGEARVAELVATWLQSHPGEAQEILALLDGADVVVNAAGLAAPAETDRAALMGANAVLPGIVAVLTAQAGVPRLIHVSTAAVQGRQDPLDETPRACSFSPYSASKAAGERILRSGALDLPGEVVIYRPTSVQGPDRAMTRSLVRLAELRALPVCDGGNVPLPTCLVESVVGGIVHLAGLASPCPEICLQPWEGMTTRLLMAAFAPHGESVRLLHLPKTPARLADRFVRSIAHCSAPFEAQLRRAELLAFGQAIRATALEASGFRPAADFTDYQRLATRVRLGRS